jgi:hypothetical protein
MDHRGPGQLDKVLPVQARAGPVAPMVVRLDHIGRDNNTRGGFLQAPEVCLCL